MSVCNFQYILHLTVHKHLDGLFWQALYVLKKWGKRFHAYDELITFNESPHSYEVVTDAISLPFNADEFYVALSWTNLHELLGRNHCLINDLDLITKSKYYRLIYFPNDTGDPGVDNNVEHAIINNFSHDDIL